MANKNTLPVKLAKKYQAQVEPSRLHCPIKDERGKVIGEKVIDMRTMSEEEAEWLVAYDSGRYLKKAKTKP